VRFRVKLKKLIGGTFQARCLGSFAGDVVVEANTREAVLSRAREEIRYRIEWCPCTGVADDYVELEVDDEAPSPWRGSVL
jgi:hypothetical protein